MEIWKPISRYMGVYEVSNLGRVKRLASIKPKKTEHVLKPQPCGTKREYRHVRLCVGGVYGAFLVHRLVMEAFVGLCPDDMEVNHKNGNASDNRLENLEYMTTSENILHSIHVLGANTARTKLNTESVLEIKHLLAQRVPGYVIAVQFGVTPGTVSMIKRGASWRHVQLPAAAA